MSLPGVVVDWHFLSLDAPTVAVVWAWSFARALGIGISATAIAVLGIGTWMIYVVDRLLDARWTRHAELRERHFFHARHRRAFIVALCTAGAALAWLIAVMPAPARHGDAMVFAASMLYFAGAHSPWKISRTGFGRQVAVGILFACAVAVPAWSARPPHVSPIVSVVLFAALCALNCIAIETWELESRRGASVSAIAVGLSIAAAATLSVPGLRATGELLLTAAVVCSALLLLALDVLHRRVTRNSSNPETSSYFLLALRIAADAALLTPVLFVLPWRP